jgi:hypothetical protein
MSVLTGELVHPKTHDLKEMSKIDNNISIISEVNEASDLNACIISKGSSCSRKIKRLGKSKIKENSQIKQDTKNINK